MDALWQGVGRKIQGLKSKINNDVIVFCFFGIIEYWTYLKAEKRLEVILFWNTGNSFTRKFIERHDGKTVMAECFEVSGEAEYMLVYMQICTEKAILVSM